MSMPVTFRGIDGESPGSWSSRAAGVYLHAARLL